jgi:protein phosphatase
MVSDRDIWRVVQGNPSLQSAAEQLIAMARENGGEDNITVVIVGFEADDANQMSQNT